MSLGARMAGIDVQIVVEADKHAAATYLHNHTPKVSMFIDDIRHFQKMELDNHANEPVVVFGGPPCQGFSTSNQRTRSSENQNNWLFQEFLRVVSLYMPEWIVFENVKGILETEGGIFANQMLESLTKLGYHCESAVLNAENYGVPQKRDRFFIVGNLHGRKFKFPESGFNAPVTVKDALEDLPHLENGSSICYKNYKNIPQLSDYARRMRGELDGCNNHLVTRNANFIIERYKHIPQGGNWESIPAVLMENYKDRSRCHTGIYRRLCEDSPSIVIGNYRKNMLIHPNQHRGLSVREAARLQSFPDSFVFKGSIGFQQQQVGNAVPPLLAKAIFEKVKEY